MADGLGGGLASAAPGAISTFVEPIRALDQEKPLVSIETNFVLDSSTGAPTGYVELAVKVKTPVVYYKDNTLTEIETDPNNNPTAVSRQTTFRNISLALRYNPDLLIPVSWDHETVVESGEVKNAYPDFFLTQYRRTLAAKGITEASTTAAILAEFSDAAYNQKVSMPTERNTMINASGAYVGGPDGVISIFATSMEDIVFEEETPIVMVRFLYRDKDRAGTANRLIKEYVKANPASETKYSVESLLVHSGHDSITSTTKNNFFWFANDGEADKGAVSEQILFYTAGRYEEEINNQHATISGENEYYSTKTIYNGDEYTSLPPIAMPIVTLPDPGAKYIVVKDKPEIEAVTPPAGADDIHAPITDGSVVYAKARRDGQKGSYTSNLLFTSTHNDAYDTGSNVRFGLRAGPTYRGRGDGGIGGTQILFYDWDDTLIGSLIVGGGDVRAAVNDYVEQNLVHPDLRASTVLNGAELNGNVPADFAAAGFNVNSLDPSVATDAAKIKYYNLLNSKARDYTYRGKYGFTVGKKIVDNAGTIEDNYVAGSAEQFPLTNKLDYVFYRHLNTVTRVADGDDWTDYYTVTDLTKDATAAQYPWCYGWAIVEDPANTSIPTQKKNWDVMKDVAKLEDTWTTAGVGELSAMDTGKNTAMPTVSGTASVSVKYPAGMTTDWSDTANAATYEPTTAGLGYAYTTAKADSNSYLRFADFADMDKLLKDGQDVLIVKAVYEPGDELLEGASYRLQKNPKYNKLNTSAASAGGAYSMRASLERASTEKADGYVRGASRVREPAIRMDTTYDQKWIQDLAKGVDHDLDNASISVAMKQTETTYTKIDADNGDEITFTLSLSARQNKINYLLIDMHGSNFIGGGQRSDSNFNRSGDAFAIDNYNYYAIGDNDSVGPEGYFIVQNYGDREGSHGFVLYGTINYLMQTASQANEGKLTNSSFNSGAGYAVMIDANLRTDNKGTQPTSGTVQDTMRTKLLACAAAAKTAKISSPTDAWQYWDDELDCACLSYHQIQWYILDGTLYSRSVADSKKLSWCHLHDSCAAQSSGKPTSWSELIAAAYDPSKNANIEKLLLPEAENMSHIRMNNDGEEFLTIEDFSAAVVRGATVLKTAGIQEANVTWDMLQYAILNNAVPANDTYSRANYWWYDGATSLGVAPTSLSGTVDLVKKGVVSDPTLMPDKLTSVGIRTAKLKAMSAAFDANDTPDGVVATAWKNMTENLVANWTVDSSTGNETTAKFINYSDYQDAMIRVVGVANGVGATPSNDPDYWWKIQHLILNPSETVWPTLTTEKSDYWWHNGTKFLIVTDLWSMLEIAAISDDAGSGAWNRFDLNRFNSVVTDLTGLSLTFDGSDKIDTAEEFSNFKTTMVAFVNDSNVAAANVIVSTNQYIWEDIQYYVIHGDYDNDIAFSEYGGKEYYWWKSGTTITAPTILTAPGYVTGLVDTSFLSAINGNPNAWDNLTEAMIATALLKGPNAADVVSGSTVYATADDVPAITRNNFITKMDTLVTVVMSGVSTHPESHTAPTLSWGQIQDYIVTGVYTPNPTEQQESDWANLYWWISEPKNPNITVTANTEVLDEFINTYLQSDATIDSLTAAKLKTNSKGDLNFQATAFDYYVTKTLKSAGKPYLKSLIAAATANGQELSTLTWYQIQYALLDPVDGGGGGGYLSPYDAYVWGKPLCTWRPDWVDTYPVPSP